METKREAKQKNWNQIVKQIQTWHRKMEEKHKKMENTKYVVYLHANVEHRR